VGFPFIKKNGISLQTRLKKSEFITNSRLNFFFKQMKQTIALKENTVQDNQALKVGQCLDSAFSCFMQ